MRAPGWYAAAGPAYLAAKTSSIKLGTFVGQLGSRSPALLATSALSLQELSGGRFLLGIGTSGPRVMEGWHGVRFRKPVQTTGKPIEIIRIVGRGERLEHQGEIYPLPLPDSSGAPLRRTLRMKARARSTALDATPVHTELHVKCAIGIIDRMWMSG